jgi:NAD(P)H-quinone oxidoreductase subunit 6
VSSPADLLFYLLAAITIASAAVVALGRNILHSVFFLLVAFTGVAGLFVLLHADFLAAVQVIVYVGGILVLIIFAVMMTKKVRTPEVSNESVGLWRGLLLGATALGLLLWIVLNSSWFGGRMAGTPGADITTVESIGQSLLGGYLFPFEVASVVLLAALVAAAILVRKEVRGNNDGTAE